MQNKIPEFIKNANNVYRTRCFIIKQVIGIQYDGEQNNVVYSHDSYYRRTPERDKEYEIIFCRRNEPDGRRLPSTMYARRYID